MPARPTSGGRKRAWTLACASLASTPFARALLLSTGGVTRRGRSRSSWAKRPSLAPWDLVGGGCLVPGAGGGRSPSLARGKASDGVAHPPSRRRDARHGRRDPGGPGRGPAQRRRLIHPKIGRAHV